MIPRVLAALVVAAFFGMELVFRGAPPRTAPEARTQDRGSTRLLTVGYAVAVLALAVGPLWGPRWSSSLCWGGLLVAILGMAWRAWAMKRLGAFYTQTLRTHSTQRLVTTGPYRRIRHPGYSGSLMVWCGAAVASGSVLASVVVIAVLVPAYVYRIVAEEQMLERDLGDAYAAYTRHTWRLLPFLY